MRFSTSATLAIAAAAALPALAAPTEELIARAKKGSRFGNALSHANNAIGIANGVAGIASQFGAYVIFHYSTTSNVILT